MDKPYFLSKDVQIKYNSLATQPICYHFTSKVKS